jgi:hypothetical protein
MEEGEAGVVEEGGRGLQGLCVGSAELGTGDLLCKFLGKVLD